VLGVRTGALSWGFFLFLPVSQPISFVMGPSFFFGALWAPPLA
jgi:hypothetical protein